MCRARAPAWAQVVRANGATLINQTRWKFIQKAFPVEVRNKREGKSGEVVIEAIAAYKKSLIAAESSSSSSSADDKASTVIAKPGEVRQEYLELLKREEEKARLQREKEEKESMEFIRALLVIYKLCYFSLLKILNVR